MYVVFSLSYWRTTILDSSANTKHSLAAASNPSQNKTVGEKILRLLQKKAKNETKEANMAILTPFGGVILSLKLFRPIFTTPKLTLGDTIFSYKKDDLG